jgi:hypothetical protein
MSLKDTIERLKSKIDIIHQSIDSDILQRKIELTPEDLKLPEFDTSKIANKLEQFRDTLRKRRLKKQNKDNIFSQLIEIFDKVLSAGRSAAESERFVGNQRLRQHVIDSAEITANSAKTIVMDCVKSALFAGDGICGGNSLFLGVDFDSVKIKPKEIDFLNMLRVDPESDYGKLMYEKEIVVNNKEKINRNLYELFTSGSTYEYDTPSERTLFTMSWDSEKQEYNVTNLTMGSGSTSNIKSFTGVSVNQFLDDYYSNMEWPDINHILRNAMLLTIKAANVSANKKGVSIGTSLSGMEDSLSWSPELDDAINFLERMLNKLFAFCNNRGRMLSGQTATELLNENEEDDEFYFDFDDVEGIDLEEEDARKRKVLKFKDCNNFEVPYNATIMEDFIYLEDKLNRNDWVRKTLDKSAMDAYEQSDFSIELPDYQLSINLGFILNIPKAVVMSIISPKMFLPIVTIYKLFTPDISIDTNITAAEIMRRLKKLFKCVITELFWKFLRELWEKLKADLKNFLQRIIRRILREKLKRYYIVVMALISLLKKIIENGLDNCGDLFAAIGAAIDGALDSSGVGSLPNALLLIADKLPGFSAIKTHMESVEKMKASGVFTGDVNGEPNYLMAAFLANTTSMADNIAKTPFISTNKGMVGSSASGPVYIPPGQTQQAALMKTK